jgi:hypothetical protein
LVDIKGIEMTLSMYKNFNTNRQALDEMFNATSKETIWINRFIPSTFSNIKDANAIVLKIKTGAFSSRTLSADERNQVVSKLLELGFKDLTYTKYGEDTLIFDTFTDEKGCLINVYKQIKLLPNKFKIILGFSFFDKDRIVIVKNKFWEGEDKRPKGYHFTNDLT